MKAYELRQAVRMLTLCALVMPSLAAMATPLTDAVDAGDINQVRTLVSQGAQVNEKDDEGAAALHHVFSFKYAGDPAKAPEIAEYLIEHGADINGRDDRGITPLFSMMGMYMLGEAIAAEDAQNGHQQSADEQRKIAAIRAAAVRLATLLLEKGADVNAKSVDGATPLHLAAAGRDNDISRMLITRGASVNAQTGDGLTPLYFSAGMGSVSNTTLLLAHGADVNVRTKAGKTPLAIAIKEKHPDVAALIRAAGGTE